MEAAALLGASRSNLSATARIMRAPPDCWGGFANCAAPFGLTLDLEYMVFSGVRSLSAALKLAAAVDRPNLQVLVDALHWMRAG